MNFPGVSFNTRRTRGRNRDSTGEEPKFNNNLQWRAKRWIIYYCFGALDCWPDKAPVCQFMVMLRENSSLGWNGLVVYVRIAYSWNPPWSYVMADHHTITISILNTSDPSESVRRKLFISWDYLEVVPDLIHCALLLHFRLIHHGYLMPSHFHHLSVIMGLLIWQRICDKEVTWTQPLLGL